MVEPAFAVFADDAYLHQAKELAQVGSAVYGVWQGCEEMFSKDPIGFAAGDANLYRYVGNGPTMRVDPSGLDWEWAWHWHHTLPQAIFNEGFMKEHGIKNLDINRPKYGYMLRGIDHLGADCVGVHSQGWNQAWEDWIADQKANGRKITKASIERRLSEMVDAFELKERGFKARYSFENKQRAYRAADRLWRRGIPVKSALAKGVKTPSRTPNPMRGGAPTPKGTIAGGLIGVAIGLICGSDAGADELFIDSIAGTSTMADGEPDWDQIDYNIWDAYMEELSRLEYQRQYENDLDFRAREDLRFPSPRIPHPNSTPRR